MSLRLDALTDYKELFRRDKINVAGLTTTTAFALGAAVVFAPLAYVAAPAIAAALGAGGLLGAAGTGTMISTLSGAALTSASLAAIGGGLGVAGGTFFVTAAGAALGGYKGGVVSNSYFGDVDDFAIERVQRGRGPAVLVINGFLTEKDDDTREWERGLEARFGDNPWYHVKWESKRLYDIGKMTGGAFASAAFKTWAEKVAQRASKAASNPVGMAALLADLLGNPWHTACVRASKTGILLADLLARTNNPDGFVIMGHSLGARVAYYALEALATRDSPIIREAYLLGGAIGRDDTDGWSAASRAVTERLVNAHSSNDAVLRYLYRAGSAFFSEPVGVAPIEAAPDKIINVDASDIVMGHSEYKAQLSQIFRRVDASANGAAKS